MKNSAFAAAPVLSALALSAVSTATWADGPPKLEMHLWGGNEVADSGAFGLRSAEIASWVTPRDRFALGYDNSLSLDNPALARDGVGAEAWSLGYLHDFSGNYLVSGSAGSRDLADGASQDIYKFEFVRLNDRPGGQVRCCSSARRKASGSAFATRTAWSTAL